MENFIEMVGYMGCLRVSNKTRGGLNAYVTLANLGCISDYSDACLLQI